MKFWNSYTETLPKKNQILQNSHILTIYFSMLNLIPASTYEKERRFIWS
jgi:hypothetical protein